MGGPGSADELEHFGVKGMHWGQHKGDVQRLGALGAAAVGSRPATKTKTAEFKKQVGKAGGVKNISDKELKSMLARMNMESQFSKLSTQHTQEIQKGRRATLKFLGEFGKVALPIAVGLLANEAHNRSKGSTRGHITVTRPVVNTIQKTLGS
jgi:hypothetical protein